jgi:hypothetical protein
MLFKLTIDEVAELVRDYSKISEHCRLLQQVIDTLFAGCLSGNFVMTNSAAAMCQSTNCPRPSSTSSVQQALPYIEHCIGGDIEVLEQGVAIEQLTGTLVWGIYC